MKATPQSASPQNSVPYRITAADRIPAERYFDAEFFKLECERLWPRVWQMACRLEEIPRVGDFVEYEILDKSVIVIRTSETEIRAYHNACRHRGMQLVKDRGHCAKEFVCPFHGWRYGLDGRNTYAFQPDLFSSKNMDPEDLRLPECRVDTWGGCAFINFDDNAPGLQESLEPFASYHEARGASRMRTQWWHSTILPVNWKLAMEGFMEGYHVRQTHPQLLPAFARGPQAIYRVRGGGNRSNNTQAELQKTAGSVQNMIDGSIHFLKSMGEGMGAMVLDRDVQVAESLRNMELPENPAEAIPLWNERLLKELTKTHRAAGLPIPDLFELAKSTTGVVHFAFPHFFLLPTFGNMASYRIRPLGPESTLFEIWSLTLYPEGQDPPRQSTPIPMSCDDPRWPPVPRQDFANLPKQQKGVHSSGFEFMRLSEEVEGLVSNYQRLIDGYLGGLGYDKLLPAVQQVSGPIDAAIHDLGF